MTLKDEEDQASTSSSQSTAVTETGSVRSGRPISRSSVRRPDSTQSLNLLAGAALTQVQQLQQPSKRSACISRALTNERTLTGRSSRSAAWGESAYVADTEESELRALWSVIKYAQYQNPKEFDLPKDLLPGIKLPGSYKTLAERKTKSIIDLENGIIPRPVRRCFVCSRTCMLAPLLPCDYCSSCFHLECLDPPLPHFPPRSDRWMCPNHVEHITERYLVRSIRLTERMQIWSDLAKVSKSSETPTHSQPIERPVRVDRPRTPPLEPVPPYELFYGPDEEAAILADLMRKVQRGRAEQASLITSLIGTTETLAGEQRELTTGLPDRSLWRLTRTKAVHPRVLPSDGNSMRVVVPPAVKAMYARGVKRVPRPSEVKPDVPQPRSPRGDDSALFVRGLLEFYLKSSSLTCREENPKESVADEAKLSTPDSSVCPQHEPSKSQLTTDINEPWLTIENCVKKLAEIGSCLQVSGLTISYCVSNDNTTSCCLLVHHNSDLPADKRDFVDLPLIISLVEQRIRQISGRTVDATLPNSLGLVSPLSESPLWKLRARAVFTPCGGTHGPVVRMHYRQLTVGTSPDCHLLLNDHRLNGSTKSCRFVSPHHATIFYDEWTHHFELINYSEFGSRVDGVTYSNDVEPRWSEMSKASSAIDRVRELSRAEFPRVFHHEGSRPKRPRMHGRRSEGYRHAYDCCECTSLDTGFAGTSPQKDLTETCMSGWEGSAIVRHGSLIQFGCYKFVMSLVDIAPTNRPNAPPELPVTVA
ncbi:PHD finger protein 12 [Clonorchis sinensis]|uniref:PHD finger protein 12 n=1 Tax=Clonorchis sinensis TaxID=79923 RepID=G7YGP4_CLOSI|nr:PHD finger protein 12 [Clonorchis sinensis]